MPALAGGLRLIAIAMAHSENQLTSMITMTLFATGVAASVLLILSHDRPFTGEVSVKPAALLQVMPESDRSYEKSELVPRSFSFNRLRPTT